MVENQGKNEHLCPPHHSNPQDPPGRVKPPNVDKSLQSAKTAVRMRIIIILILRRGKTRMRIIIILSLLHLKQKQKNNYIKKIKSPKNENIYRKLSSSKFLPRFSKSPIPRSDKSPYTAFWQVLSFSLTESLLLFSVSILYRILASS